MLTATQPLRIMMVSSEASPWAKSGGLADAVIRYAMAGLEAMAAAHRPQPPPAAKPGRGARRTASSV